MERDYALESLKFLATNRNFLGREFLTWLWFSSEAQNHTLSIPDLGQFTFYVDDRIVMTATQGSVHETVLKGGTPAYASESRFALMSGKLVAEAKFILQDGERQWMWSMRGDDLTIRGLRLPSCVEDDASSHIIKRITYCQILLDCLDYLFKNYVAIRLTPAFDHELELIAAWLNKKQTAEAV